MPCVPRISALVGLLTDAALIPMRADTCQAGQPGRVPFTQDVLAAGLQMGSHTHGLPAEGTRGRGLPCVPWGPDALWVRFDIEVPRDCP